MEITLNKNGFHRKLQTFCFGKNCPLYQSFCPYFWLTIFSGIITFIIPIVPLIYVIKYILMGLMWCMEGLGNAFEKHICEPLMKSKALNMDKDELLMSWFSNSNWDDYNFWYYEYFDRKKLNKNSEVRSKKFEIWKANNPNWETLLQDYKEKRRLFHIEQEAEKERLRNQIEEERIIEEKRNARKKQLRQQAFTSIVKYTKWLAFVIAAAVVCLIGYGAYNLYLYIADHFYLDKLIAGLKFAGVLISIIGVAALIIYILAKMFKSVTCKAACFLCGREWKWLKTLGTYIGKFFIGLGNIISFLWNGIIMFKKEYCPGINWK